MPVPNRALYFRLVSGVTRFARIYNRLEVSGTKNVPSTGGALICPRHENYSDIIFIASGVQGRVLHFLVRQGVDEIPLVGKLIRRIGNYCTIPTSFGVATDKAQAQNALNAMAEIMKEGHLGVIFPEGTINPWFSRHKIIGPRGLKPFKTGAVRAAARAGVPIIPLATTGTRWVVPNLFNLKSSFGGPNRDVFVPVLLPQKVRIHFGEPFVVDPLASDSKEIARSETKRLEETTADILDQMCRRENFLLPDFLRAGDSRTCFENSRLFPFSDARFSETTETDDLTSPLQ